MHGFSSNVGMSMAEQLRHAVCADLCTMRHRICEGATTDLGWQHVLSQHVEAVA